MSIRDFLDRVEEAVLNSMEIVEDHVETLRDKFEARERIEQIKNSGRNRRHKSQKQLRR